MGKLMVIAYVDTSGEEPVIVKFGPTSERADLLRAYDDHWPSGAVRRVIVSIMDSGLLQVSKAALEAALKGA